MAIHPAQNTIDSIMRRIDTMIDELHTLRQVVQTLGLQDNQNRLLNPSVQPQKRSVLDILSQAPGQKHFSSADAVDNYIAEERMSWDSF